MSAGHEERRDEAGAYLLGSLGPGEAADFERHLAACAECRTDVEWLRPAVEALPDAAPGIAPPPGLRVRLMEEARGDARRRRPARAARDGDGFLDRLVARRRLPRLWPAAVLAALALAAIAGYAIRGPAPGDDRGMVAAARGRGVTARLVAEGDAAMLRLSHVRRLPPDRVLEAWVRREDAVEPVPALFMPDRAGRAMTMIADMRGVEEVMVTAEPREGSDHPTSAPLVRVAMPR